MPPVHDTTTRFSADAMLARLARWLRLLGFDTLYDPAVHDHELVRVANDEHRVLLTRDRHLLRELRPAQAVEVRHDAPLDQLRQLVAALQLPAPPPSQWFSRCTVCNTPLGDPLPADEALSAVPPGVRGLPGPVHRCPGCGRVYWHGSHARRMRATLARALPDWRLESPDAGP